MNERDFEMLPSDRLRIAEAGVVLMQEQHVELEVLLQRALSTMRQMGEILDGMEQRIERLEEVLRIR